MLTSIGITDQDSDSNEPSSTDPASQKEDIHKELQLCTPKVSHARRPRDLDLKAPNAFSY